MLRRKGPSRLLLIFSTLLLGGCALNGPQSIFDTAGPVAASQADLFVYIFWFAVFVFVAVTAALVYAVFKYRRRGDDDGSVPDQIHGVAWLEAAWTVAPAVILVLIGFPTVRLILETESRVEPGQQDLVVNVTGYQWWWEFEYPELGVTTANELHIPTGRRVVLNLNSGDVLHSFWVPRLAGKRDLIPNQDNQLWLSADEAGLYRGQCAELCLGAHAYMRMRVIAESEAEFSAWANSFQQGGAQQVQAQVGTPQLEAGKALFKTKGCANCHAIAGYAQGQAAPDLTNFGVRTSLAAGVAENTPENLTNWIRNPQELKPGNLMPTLWAADDPKRDEEVAALVAYLESLGTQAPPTASVQARR
ncbi:MAG: Cytochrome c oxidase polypeptide II [uncultured Truepera sp.]|uniref:Cytochrome c oxidase subunit 2 n=1 Tax=uncultured Truepera sp. TaxID=543023 RepID=A0A6J4VQF0_9DEIN|nr:MAG: Cytochrome c oxidase polypeptide II [uncultured Truepera sp.]